MTTAARPVGRLIHGGSSTLAYVRRCPCVACVGFRERTRANISHDSDAVDWVAVDRVATGDGYQERLTVAEREAVVILLHRRGCNDQVIARRTGMADRTVLRIRKRLNLPAVTR